MILDSRGDAVARFDNETAARATLRAIAQAEPQAATDIVMITYDDEGVPVGEATTVDDLPLPYSFVFDSSVLSAWVSSTTAPYKLSPAEAELDRWQRLIFPPARVSGGEREPQAA